MTKPVPEPITSLFASACATCRNRAAVGKLEAAGYNGYYDVELMGEDIEQTGYQELVAQSKAAFEQLVSQ